MDFQTIVAAIFGLIIGSFLNVVIYRLHTGKSLNDRSHCLSCAKQLTWYELFPVISYLVLRGRCRFCHSSIPYRYMLVEVLTAGLFVLTYLYSMDLIHFLLLTVLCSLLVVGLVYDLYHMIIPDEVSYGAVAVVFLILFYESVISGVDAWALLNALGGAGVAFLLFSSLWYFSQGRAFGFGDAKLSLSLGALVGIEGVFSFMVLSFWIGAAVSLFIMGWQAVVLNTRRHLAGRRRVTMKSEVPFAPFLIAAFFLTYFFELNALLLIEALYGGI